MRERPPEVLSKLEEKVIARHLIIVSAVTCAEMKLGAVAHREREKHETLVNHFLERIDDVLPLTQEAIQAASQIEKHLMAKGTPIGDNDTLIAGHAIAAKAVLVTNNIRHFNKVPSLYLEDWVS